MHSANQTSLPQTSKEVLFWTLTTHTRHDLSVMSGLGLTMFSVSTLVLQQAAIYVFKEMCSLLLSCTTEDNLNCFISGKILKTHFVDYLHF